MFENLDQKNKQPNASDTPEDIFAETDQAAPPKRPNLPPSLSAEQVNRMSSSQKKFSAEKYRPYRAPMAKGVRTLRRMIVAVIIIAAVGFGSYFVYNYLFAAPDAVIDANNQVSDGFDMPVVNDNLTQELATSTETTNTTTTSTITIVEEDDTATTTATSTIVVKPDFLTADVDGDGLNGEEEIDLGTNINKADTDNDGLTDWQEVKIYSTDPLNPDTDGDTYSDGEEVNNGYNPSGEGKI